MRKPGAKYRPSNGTEGEIFMSQYCWNCAHDADENKPCPILGASLAYSISDPKYPEQWQYNECNDPVCTEFLHEDDARARKERDGDPAPRCEATIDMFSEPKKGQ